MVGSCILPHVFRFYYFQKIVLLFIFVVNVWGVTQPVNFCGWQTSQVLVYERSVIYMLVYIQQSQFIFKFIATPGQILSGDGIYIIKSCHSKVKKNKVPCCAFLDKLLGQQENYRHQRQRIQVISQRQFLLQEEFCGIIYSRYVSHI